MNRLPVSVCMISGAEANRIGRALDSVAGWASEIIVVMNEDVQDGTEEICRRQGAKVFREPWKGYVAQKNSSAEKATEPWVLGLDADEVISQPLRDEIISLFFRPGKTEQLSAYSFPRCSFYCGRWIRHGDWYPDRKTRLWQRNKAHWAGIDPHDKLVVDGPVGRLHSDLLHYTAETIDRQIAKAVTYSNLFALDAMNRRQRVGWFDLFLRPVWRFVRTYFFRLGFLDGWQGCYIAWMTAFFAITRYAKVSEARSVQSQK